MAKLEQTEVVEIWKTIVGVQMHFNDIGMRIRNIFVTLLLALLAALGFMIGQDLQLDLIGMRVDFYVLMPLFGVLATYLFYFMDRYWFHRLLVGSVKHGIEIEKKYKDSLPELSLSDAIGAESPFRPRGVVKFLANILVRHEKYKEDGQLHSDGKMEFFYKLVVLSLVLLFLLLALSGGIAFQENKKAAQQPVVAASNESDIQESIEPSAGGVGAVQVQTTATPEEMSEPERTNP